MAAAVNYAAPLRRPDEQVQSEKEYLEQALRVREAKVRAKRKESREFSPAQVALLTGSLLVVLVVLSFYIMQLSNYYALKSGISSLQLEYEQTVQSNALMQDEIERSINLTDVYTYATGILGMRIPENHQIVYFEQGDSEYVSVNGVIPNE